MMASRSEEITDLIYEFSKSQYRAKEVTPWVERVEKRYLELFDRDYKYSIIHNTNGEVCGHYPRKIVFLEYESSDNNKESFESTVQISKLQDLVNRSKMARCRGRFVCPVILYNGKHVCRSSTLAGWGELYGRTGYNYIFSGCEFFREYKDRDYTAEGLVFNWNQDYVDAPLTIPIRFTSNLNINWSEYQSWDLVQQTQNYLKLLLHIINSDDENGLLVHCISGWDRTPLFVSLLRLSLWADGAIHASLEPSEILYLTIAYDWFLFGHMLPDRLSKGEEIFFFCFNFLKHIVCETFSVKKKQRRKNSQFKDADFTVDDLCQLKSRDRGSVTSLSSDFSLITEDTSAPSSLHAEATDPITTGPQASSGVYHRRKGMPLSSNSVLWNRPITSEERIPNVITEASPLGSFKSSSSSSSNHSDQNLTRTGSTPLAVPGRRPVVEYARSGSSLSTDYGSWQIVSGCGSIHDLPPVPSESPLPFSFQDEGPSGRMCTFVPDRQVRLEAVRELFLSAYSSTVGLKSSSPSPSGAISGLLEQFARGVGLRGTNAII
ncbi:myotubularin-related protein 14 isoform X5 [Ctenopharyngodon idella]|uniref:myotubularin-related protein 14 isoform X5 n=1 Tax=Ctenopharyngodon idella TaxID=7959 RepID=UPI002230FDCC|nr:myotubularin-related protein 14 isoform X5 [Ctenopharyngodon idella]